MIRVACSTSVPRACIAVDWSGDQVSARKRMWLAESGPGGLVRVERGRDRGEMIQHLAECAESEPCLVVGLDFAFSFPSWFLAERGLTSARELWDLVARKGEDWLERCPAPFWGRPGRPRPPPVGDESAFRTTESDVMRVRGIGPKPVFQIGGAGSVGTGSLRGMPYLAALQDAGFSIWPFDRPRLPMVVEIYPRFLTGAVNKSNELVRALYLQTRLAREAPALLDLAASSEDAFDAAVSAVRMQRFAGDFARLERRTRRLDRLEGRIWAPIRDPVFERH